MPRSAALRVGLERRLVVDDRDAATTAPADDRAERDDRHGDRGDSSAPTHECLPRLSPDAVADDLPRFRPTATPPRLGACRVRRIAVALVSRSPSGPRSSCWRSAATRSAARRPPPRRHRRRNPVALDAPDGPAVAGARHHRAQREPDLGRLTSARRRLGAPAGPARRIRPQRLPVRRPLVVGRSRTRGGADPALDAPGGCMRDERAVRARRRRPRPAARARGAPAAGRVGGDGGDHRHAAVGGGTRAGLPAQARPDRRRPAARRRCRAYRRADRRACSRSAREEGADVRYVSPWNEPNHPYFLAPQRAACDAASPSLAVSAVRRAGARREAPSSPTAGRPASCSARPPGILEPTARATSVPESSAACPRGLVCSARGVVAARATSAAPTRSAGPPARSPRGGCPRRTRSGSPRPASARRRAACRSPAGSRASAGLPAAATAAARLVREPARDARRPVHVPRGRPVPDRPRHDRPRSARGPALREWQAWGARPTPASPPPEPPAAIDPPCWRV